MKDKITFTTTLLPLNVLNGNGRIYENNDNLKETIKDFNDRVEKNGPALGTLGYPADMETILSSVSHTIKNVRIEDDKVVGDITILNTAQGKILQELMGVDIVYRPRAIGTTNPDGTVNIQKILSYDAVSSSNDSFNSSLFISSRGYGEKPIIGGRIISDLDPFGEENWDI